MGEYGSSGTLGIIWKGVIREELLGNQSEGFIFLDGYQIQRRVPLVIQDSQLVPKNLDLAFAKAWISFLKNLLQKARGFILKKKT